MPATPARRNQGIDMSNTTYEVYESDGTDGHNAGFFGYVITDTDESGETRTWSDGGYPSREVATQTAKSRMDELSA